MLSKILTFFAAILTVICSLILITEVIKDTSYIANRGVSNFYYIALSLSLLAVAFSLCLGSGKGIFRFCVLAFLPLVLMLVIGFSSPITTKSIINPFTFPQQFKGTLKAGLLSGILIGSDTSLFLLAFRKYSNADIIIKESKILHISLLFSDLIICAYCLLTTAVFGQNLASKLDDSMFSLTKLIPGIDFTELISASRILSFIIKTCVYTEGISHMLSYAFFKDGKNDTKKAKAIIFCMIPATYLFFIVFKSRLPYGAFQSFIYPATAGLSATILIYTSILKTKNRK